MVIWLIGISGSGKNNYRNSTQNIARNKNNWVFLDGDSLREVWGGELGHSISDREINAKRRSNFVISRQTKHGVIASVYLFFSLARLE